jgi:hypothetical protein
VSPDAPWRIGTLFALFAAACRSDREAGAQDSDFIYVKQ